MANRPWSVVAVAGTHSPHFESDYWCVPEVDETERGAGGYGHTGVK